jgi:hypothetical protein
VNLDGSAATAKAAAPGALAGREVKASCWQGGVKVVELPGFAAADLGGASRDAAVLLRGRAGDGGAGAAGPGRPVRDRGGERLVPGAAAGPRGPGRHGNESQRGERQ